MLQPNENHFQSGHWQTPVKQDIPKWVFAKVWNLGNCCSRAAWCMTKQTRRAVIPVRLCSKYNACMVPLSPLFHYSYPIKSQSNTSKRKTQHHTEINKPGQLMQDTWAKPVPLLTTRKVSAVFIFCYCFTTAASQGTNWKTCHGICLLWILFNSKPQRWSITNFWSELIKSRTSQTWGEVLETGMKQLESGGVQQPQKVGQKSRKHNVWELPENKWVCSVWKRQGGHSLTVHKPMKEKKVIIELCVSYGRETLKESCPWAAAKGGWH